MATSNVPVVISSFLLMMVLYGFYDFLAGHEENTCDMTYMYEYPQFLRIPLPGNVSRQYPRYKLFVYGEGVYTQQLRDGRYTGVPVLFIPGNGGSYKQARSLASVAYRRALERRLRTQLNVFAVDFNDDAAGLSGALLLPQTRFVAECVRVILKLYRPGDGGPSSVAVVAHSMGGVVARGLFAVPGFDATSVRHMILLAAPIASPPVMIDRQMAQYYTSVERVWGAGDTKARPAGGPPSRRHPSVAHVTVVSVAGGERDVQVRPHQTSHPSSDVSVASTAVPGVWRSADHQCMVWCRQLVLVVVRALHDLVTPGTRRLTEDGALARRVLRQHFVQRSHDQQLSAGFHPERVPVDVSAAARWSQYSTRQWTYTAGEVERSTYLMVPLIANPLYERATVQVEGTVGRDWLLACNATRLERGVRTCADEVTNLSGLGWLAPPLSGRDTVQPRRSAHLALRQLQGRFSHLVVAVRTPDDRPVTVHCDVSRASDRKLLVDAPGFTAVMSYLRPQIVLQKTEPGALSYNVSIKGLTEPWQAVSVLLRPLPSPGCGLQARAGLTLHVPGTPPSSRTVTASGTAEAVLTAKLEYPQPPQNASGTPSSSSTDGELALPHVTAWLDPACSYSISVQASWRQLWGQVARFFWPLLPPAVLAVLLTVLAEQLRAAAASPAAILAAAAADGQVCAAAAGAGAAGPGDGADGKSESETETTAEGHTESEGDSAPEAEVGSAQEAEESDQGAEKEAEAVSASANNAPRVPTPSEGPTGPLSSWEALRLLTPLKLVLPAQLAPSLIKYTPLAGRLPVPDLLQLTSAGVVCGPLPFLVYFVSWAMVALLVAVAGVTASLSARFLHSITAGVLSRWVGASEPVAELAVSGLARFPVLISVALAGLAVSSCGEIALGLGLLVCVVKVLQSYEHLASARASAAGEAAAAAAAQPQAGVGPTSRSPAGGEEAAAAAAVQHQAGAGPTSRSPAGGEAAAQLQAGVGPTSRSPAAGEAAAAPAAAPAAAAAAPAAAAAQPQVGAGPTSRAAAAAQLQAGVSLTVALVWLWVTLLHLPALVVWSKTRSEGGARLVGDPSLAVSLLLCGCGAVLWRESAPRHRLDGYRFTAAVVSCCAVGVFLFGMVHVYRAGWLAAIALSAVALHQLMAPAEQLRGS